MASSFRIIKDKQATSLELGWGKAPLTRSANLNYVDNWVPQTNLVTGNPFKVQIVSVGNLVVFSWDTVAVNANGSGPVTSLVFATKIPTEFIPNLVGITNDGQNFPIYIGTSNQYLLWVNDDGTVTIDVTDSSTFIADTSSSVNLWGGSVSWTTNNA